MKNLKNRKWTLAVGMVGEHNFSFAEEEVSVI
jgi:hypothetical protein